MPLPNRLTTGTLLYKYYLISQIGTGGFSEVWLAEDKSINRQVAVKVLDASTATIDERLKEARIGNKLNHENLVKVHYADVVAYNGINLVLIAMDYHQLGSIVGHLNASNFLPLKEAVSYLVDILRGLEYLHENGIYHGDIKPNNILVGPCGEGILTDYGISCHSPTLAAVKPRNFYLPHVAPEVLTVNQIGIPTDIYQVGMTAFRLLNGIGAVQDKFSRLGKSGFLDLVKRGKLIEAKDYEPFIPQNLRMVINKAIRTDAARRYQSALEMRRALEALSYSGQWTCNPLGKLEGHSDGHLYRFEELARAGGLFDFTAFKMNRASRRETRVTSFCGKKLSRADSQVMKRKFIQYVVTGKPQ